MSVINIIAQAANELVLTNHIQIKNNGSKLSVIASYKSELEEIALKYRLELIETFNGAGGLTVQGIFQVPH